MRHLNQCLPWQHSSHHPEHGQLITVMFMNGNLVKLCPLGTVLYWVVYCDTKHVTIHNQKILLYLQKIYYPNQKEKF